MKGVFPCLVRWACRAPVQEICVLFLTIDYFTSSGPTAQQAGQAVVPGHLSLNMCLWGGGGIFCKKNRGKKRGGDKKRCNQVQFTSPQSRNLLSDKIILSK